eukprot:37588-Chlamydomonas_euryale.AAC.2
MMCRFCFHTPAGGVDGTGGPHAAHEPRKRPPPSDVAGPSQAVSSSAKSPPPHARTQATVSRLQQRRQSGEEREGGPRPSHWGDARGRATGGRPEKHVCSAVPRPSQQGNTASYAYAPNTSGGAGMKTADSSARPPPASCLPGRRTHVGALPVVELRARVWLSKQGLPKEGAFLLTEMLTYGGSIC